MDCIVVTATGINALTNELQSFFGAAHEPEDDESVCLSTAEHGTRYSQESGRARTVFFWPPHS